MKVVNKRHERFTTYIGRGSIFGNPFKVGQDGTRTEVIERYETYAREHEKLMAAIKKLPTNAILGCFCKPLACHGDVIVKLNAGG